MLESVGRLKFAGLDRRPEARARTYLFLAIMAFWLATASNPAFADGDPAKGKAIFGQCSGCHATTQQDKIGPHLAGVFGRRAGTVPGFHYSKAMAGSATVWNEQTLDTFLAGPSKMFPGSSMPVSLRNAQDRADVIAYLKSLSQP
jgi:cytochrome c